MVMIQHLKLHKAIIAIALGVLALVVAKIMEANKVKGEGVALSISGVLFIIGALMFLYPILFAKKVDTEGRSVRLKPIEKDLTSKEGVELEG